jgi:hypothetical protein
MQNGLYFAKHINIIDNSITHIILLIYDKEDITPDILKTSTSILRKRALELYSLEDDSELRAIFKHFGGI